MSMMNVNKNLAFDEEITPNLNKLVIENVNEGIMITNKHNQILYVNKKFEEITGYTYEEIAGKTPKTLQAGIQELSFYEKMKETVRTTGRWQGELWNRTKSGEIYLQSLTIIAVKDKEDHIQNFIGIFSNTLYSTVERRQKYLENFYDPLTSLPNQFLFEKHMDSVIKHANETNTTFALIYFRIKDYSSINETYGFNVGDILLKKVARRMQSYFPENSLVTRWSGTDFTCVLEKQKNKEEIVADLEKLIDKMSPTYYVSGKRIELDANFGISVYREDGDSLDTLIKKAQTAMLYAKEEDLQYEFYDPYMGDSEDMFIVEQELKEARSEEQFELYYQPLVSVESNKLIGFEALIRWKHPTKGIIPPVKFIPVAEQTKMIYEIGEFVFQKACEQLKKWRDAGQDDIKIMVNLSMNQFKSEDIVSTMQTVIEETGISANDIGIELTESSLIDDMEDATYKLNQLRALGFNIAVDDFGTGYSSLGYLIEFPINRIKIDRSFTRVLHTNKKVETIVAAIVKMAKTLNIEVVVEGVETDEQFKLIEQLNCDVVQGYLFDRPLPSEKVEQKWLFV